MDVIAVIDDSEDMRTTVAGHIRHELGERDVDWLVIDSPPLENLYLYSSWVRENDVRVLVLDERLSSEHHDGAVSYAGHDVANLLRTQLPDLPQLIVTSVPKDQELDDSASDVDAIIGRDEFYGQAGRHVERMIRMGKRYVERHESDLSELGAIAELVANGSASPEDIKRLQAIRTKIHSSYSVDAIETSRQWIDAARLISEKVDGLISVLKENSGVKKS